MGSISTLALGLTALALAVAATPTEAARTLGTVQQAVSPALTESSSPVSTAAP